LDSWVLTADVGQNTVDSPTFTNTHTHWVVFGRWVSRRSASYWS